MGNLFKIKVMGTIGYSTYIFRSVFKLIKNDMILNVTCIYDYKYTSYKDNVYTFIRDDSLRIDGLKTSSDIITVKC